MLKRLAFDNEEIPMDPEERINYIIDHIENVENKQGILHHKSPYKSRSISESLMYYLK